MTISALIETQPVTEQVAVWCWNDWDYVFAGTIMDLQLADKKILKTNIDNYGWREIPETGLERLVIEITIDEKGE